MDFMDLVNTRKSVRTYTDRSVEEEKIVTILEAARLAPSAVNCQPWQYIVVKEKVTIEKIADSSKINSWLKKAPCVIIACADPNVDHTVNGMDYYLVDLAISMEHLILAATELGLGTCWLASYDEGKVRSILGIPEKMRVVAMTPLGYPAEKESIGGGLRKTLAGSKKRKPMEEMLHREKW